MTQTLRVGLDVSAVPPKPAGAGRYIIEIAQRLARVDGIDPLFITRTQDTQRWQELGGHIHSGVPDLRPQRLLWEQLMLPRVLKQLHADVHHSPHYTMPERAKVPVVVTIHDLTFFDNPEWHERSKAIVFRRAIKQAVKRAAHLIAVSHDTAARMKERFGDVEITVIPHGIDHERFNVTPKECERDELIGAGIPADYIAFVGTIEPRKNLPRLVQAFDKIAAKHPSLHLVIAGQRGWALEEFDVSVTASPYAGRIIQPGYLPEHLVPALLRNARVVSYPSLAEGFGLPALEALACGAPLVAGSGSALSEVVGGAGILVDQYDIEALARALEGALDADREAARINGAQAASNYTWEAAVQKHVEVYRLAATAQ